MDGFAIGATYTENVTISLSKMLTLVIITVTVMVTLKVRHVASTKTIETLRAVHQWQQQQQ